MALIITGGSEDGQVVHRQRFGPLHTTILDSPYANKASTRRSGAQETRGPRALHAAHGFSTFDLCHLRERPGLVRWFQWTCYVLTAVN